MLIQAVLNECDYCIALGQIGMTSDVDVTAGVMGIPLTPIIYALMMVKEP
jgi:hypothetical protein